MATYKVYFANAGAPTTGLSATWQSMYWVSDCASITATPDIIEIGGGWYKFTYVASADIVGVIDGTSALTVSADRFVPIDIGPNDNNIAYLDASVLAIPTTTLLSADSRLNYLDGSISAVSSQVSGLNNISKQDVADARALATSETAASKSAEERLRKITARASGDITDSSSSSTTIEAFKDEDGTTAFTATVDSSGNRTVT